jgi:hypothetical protein
MFAVGSCTLITGRHSAYEARESVASYFPISGKGADVMSENGIGKGLVIYFNSVHIISVNHKREEIRLFENGGSTEGKLVFTTDEPAGKASVKDPFQLIQLALEFGVHYDMLSQVASKDALSVFEKIGAKEFIEKVASLTTDQERRERLHGLGYRFGGQSKDGKTGEPAKQTEAAASTPATQPAGKASEPASSPPPTEGKKKGTK